VRRQLQESDNKYARGTVAIAAGSIKYPGAALLATGGARRGNAGYVKYLSRNSKLRDLVIQEFPDVVPISSLTDQHCDAFVIGPGAPTLTPLPKSVPVVLDGSAISVIQKTSIRKHIEIPVVTPHEGELRYLGKRIETHLTQSDRISIASNLAGDFEIIVVLKGHRTVIAAPNGRFKIDEIGGPELATAGSGDVLAGLIGSMLVATKEGLDPFDLVCDAVQLHSLAGRRAARDFTSVTALEIITALAHV
jgi:hydroxyethylthiazole kinase-like uncharacterized protein yjeF